LFLIPALIRSRPSCILVVEPLFFTGWVCLVYGALAKVKVFSDLWDLWPEAFPVDKVSALKFAFPWDIIFAPLLLSRYLRFLLYQRIYIVSNSYKQILPLSSASRTKLFYHCIGNTALDSVANVSFRSLVRAQTEPSFENLLSTFKLCYVGTLGGGCAMEEVIEAINELNRSYPEQFELHVAGSPVSFFRLFQDVYLPPNVKHSGFISSSQLEDFYSQTHAILMPYKRFSPIALPIKFFDGLRYSKPFISSLTLEVSSIIDAEHIGINYHAGDVQSLVEAIVRIRDEYSSFLSSIQKFSKCTDLFSPCDVYSSFASDIVSSCAS
jgi:glycosyltransferase involved in cell wall biosynthesis